MYNQNLPSTKYASNWRRLFAHLIDTAILASIMFWILFFVNPLPNDHVIIFKELAGLILGLLYYTILTASHIHGSLGKHFMKIIVVDHNMHTLSLRHSLGRYFAYYFSYATLGLGFIIIAMTKKHTGLHDIIAKTYVINR